MRTNQPDSGAFYGTATEAAPARGQRRGAVVPDSNEALAGERASNAGTVLFPAVVFVVVFAAILAMACAIGLAELAALIMAITLAVLAVMAVHVAQEWEKVVVLRLGKFNRVVGPGLFFTVPFVESNAMRVDTRMRTTPFSAEETLTSDLVPLNVDAVLFWTVWDAKLACTEVNDFTHAVKMAAQTALRDAIGRGGVAEVAIRREQLDRELKRRLEEKLAAWGITILSVEVRDILVPKELQDVMSLEAQAEQRKKARIILMEAEQDIAEMMDAVGTSYADNDSALRLRAMHLLYKSVRETGGTVVVPSSFSEGFGDVLPNDVKKAMRQAAH